MEKELQRSQRKKQPISIIYLSSSGKITQRTILVKRITDTHVLAYCTTRKQYRQFEINQILAQEKSLVT